jgi:DNA-binding response OmpR family regulator
MHVLIVESSAELGRIWAAHMERSGHRVSLVQTGRAAMDVLRHDEVHMIVLSIVLADGNPFAISDYACYRWPDAKVIFVTRSGFFSDGSIFLHAQNACACMSSTTPPGDLASLVEHYGARTPA